MKAKMTNAAQKEVVKYGSINVRSLVMKNDKYKRELCGAAAAAATEWVLEFQARQLDVVGLQECRVCGNKVGSEGPYRTFYTGEEEKKVHGVGIFILERIMNGEFEVQHVSARCMWIVGELSGVKQVIVSAYAPTNDEKNAVASDNFYEKLEKEVASIREKHGTGIGITILGDFNARVGNDGSDLYNAETDEILGTSGAKGVYGLPEINENGQRLILFCERMELKIMDTFSPRPYDDYGTWRCNRSVDKGYSAALDHILVNNIWWYGVKGCGVTDDQFSMRTDHRLIEIELFSRWATYHVGLTKEKHERKERTEQEVKQSNRARFGKLLLHYRSHENEDNCNKMRKVKTDYEWAIKSEKLMYGEKDLTAVDLLGIINKARDAVIDINWPEGVPAMPKDKPRFWYEDTDQSVNELVKKKKCLQQKWLNFQRIKPSPQTLEICLRDMKRTQQRLRALLRTRENLSTPRGY